MSLISQAFPFTYKGRPARMYVVRNNAAAYGRMCVGEPLTEAADEYDVWTARDHYDKPDDEAAQAFINAARRGKAEVSTSWSMEGGEE